MKDTIHIDSWRSLSQLGINALTGEADRLSMRLLCDLNDEGRELVLDYLGLPADTHMADNWNQQVDGLPAVASVMLHRESYRQIAEFGLFRRGALANIYVGSQIMGIFSRDRLTQYEEYVESVTNENPAMRARILRNSEETRATIRVQQNLNAESVELMLDYFGLPVGTTMPPAAAVQHSEVSAVASILLHKDSLPHIIQFTNFRKGALANVFIGEEVIGVFSQEDLAHYEELSRSSHNDHPAPRVSIHRNMTLGSSAPGYGTRNTHLMSGRTM
jgi:hypothetical protein